MLALLTTGYVAALLTQTLTTRIHTGLVARKESYIKFWYLCRAFDLPGRGYVELDAGDICQLLKISRPTLYEWLRTGRNQGAFRRYRFKGNTLSVWLGGLHKLCHSLGLKTWGAVATVPLTSVLESLKATATAIAVQEGQKKSLVAAWRSLKKQERQIYKIPTPDQLLSHSQQSSQQPTKRGKMPGVIWKGQKRIFVGNSFLPYGASQVETAAALNISDRTVRRHLTHLEVERRQIVQAKAIYSRAIAFLRQHEISSLQINLDTRIASDRSGVRLYEPNGVTSSRRTEGHEIKPGRIFTYKGKDWIYRCNLYDLDHSLTSMKASRHSYKLLMNQNRLAGRGGGECDIKVAYTGGREKEDKIHNFSTP